MWNNEKILVTGGNGFLGGTIVKSLIKKSCRDIAVFCRTPSPALEKLGVKVISGDLRDPSSLNKACENRTIIFHTAAKAGVWGEKKDFFEINLDGTINLIASAHKNNIELLIHTSSPSVVIPKEGIENADENTPYPKRYLSYYAESKALAEKAVIAASSSKLRTIALRPHLIWGPEDPHILPRIIKMAKEKKLLRIGDGKNLVDMTYIDNAAEAHLLAAEKLRNSQTLSGRKYFLSDDCPVNLWEWIDTFLKALDMPPVQKSISLNKAMLAGKISEFICRILPLGEPRMTPFTASNLARPHYFNISAAKKDLGYKPIISGDKAFKNTVEFFKNCL
jgi:nucleoside-diphosphate-sugar epimerase